MNRACGAGETDRLKSIPLTIHIHDSMNIEAEVWVRGEQHASTQVVTSIERQPRAWTDHDITEILVGMLRALDRAKNPDAEENRPVALRGFSWIVNPFENRGVVLAIEMSLGAIVAGPFDIAERELTAMVERVMAAQRGPVPRPAADTIH
jgi:hypothetical protein